MSFNNQPNHSVSARGQTPSGISMGDVWYALFRHKKKILVFGALGIVAAVVLFIINRPPYISEAKLLVRYVVESRSIETLTPDGQVKAPANTAESIINSEGEILTSLDLCRQVAELVGPAKILGRADRASDLTAAANVLYRGLSVEIPKKGSVIKVTLAYPDPELVQSILQHVIDAYFKRHAEIHRALGIQDAFLAQQIDQVRSRLVQTDAELRELRTKAGVLSLEDSKKSYTEQFGAVRQMLLAAEAELAEYQSFTKSLMPANATNAAAGANAPFAATNPPASVDRLGEYKALCIQLESLHREEMELRHIYTDENRTLVRLRDQLAKSEATRKEIELEHPVYAAFLQSWKPGSAAPSAVPAQAMDPGRARILEIKIRFLNTQLEKLRRETLALEEFESSLNVLQRRKETDEKNLRYFSAGLEQARFDEALGSGRLDNLSVVQSPSPPALDSKKRWKISAMALAAGLFGGIGLALLIEMILDHTVRRPQQLESNLGLPLFFTIPRLHGEAPAKLARLANGVPVAPGKNGATLTIPGWSHGHPLRSHIEALRDRTLMHFDGDPHKPKLIGVTGCRDGAGVTTIASALAAALSETGEGRVLLVSLNFNGQSLHPFLRGQSICPLVDVMEGGQRETALIGHNLYLASGNGGTEVLPRSMSRLVPKLKMSDYDYIVFDMPKVTRTSITSKLAGMLDLVFMVAESEKDSREMLKGACELLSDGKARFKIVLNKFQSYVPSSLHQEL